MEYFDEYRKSKKRLEDCEEALKKLVQVTNDLLETLPGVGFEPLMQPHARAMVGAGVALEELRTLLQDTVEKAKQAYLKSDEFHKSWLLYQSSQGGHAKENTRCG